MDNPERATEWPAAAERIRDARLAAGLTESEVAGFLKTTIHSYWDLDHYDDEAFKVASLEQLAALGRILKVEPRRLLLGPETEGVKQTVTFGDIAVRLAERISRGGNDAEECGDSIGWNVTSVLTNPQALAAYDVEALYDICKALGLDWVAALPTLLQ